MGMNYRDMAEGLYCLVKTKISWRKQDRDKIDQITEFLTREIERELAEAGLEPSISVTSIQDNTILNEYQAKEKDYVDEIDIDDETEEKVSDLKLVIKEPLSMIKYEVTPEPMSLLQRVIVEQDQASLPEIKEVPIFKHPHRLEVPVVKHPIIPKKGEKARYLVQIYCNSVIAKPPFQIFKTEDLIETNFQTDEVQRHQLVFNAVVDCHGTGELQEILPKYFVNPYVGTNEAHSLDWIPDQYRKIWQNRTEF